METLHYYERQHTSTSAYTGALAAGAVGLVLLIPGALGAGGAVEGALAFLLIAAAVAVLNFSTVSIWVYDTEVRVQFGRLLPFYTAHVRIADIVEARAIVYDPARLSPGRGLRVMELDGARVPVLRARGGRGVLLRGKDGSVIIGTQHPQRLAEVIESRGRAKAGDGP